MLGGINWSRQIIILAFAGVVSLYWTSKQGMWSAISGISEMDKDWGLAKLSLQKKLGQRFEVLDVTNQREEKRVVVLTHRKAGGMPQEVVAELFPVIKQKNVQKGRRARTAERSQRRNPRDAAWEKEEKRRKQRKERIKHGKRVVEKEAAARLRVYGDTLASLKSAYMDEHGQKRPESLIEMPDWEKEERESFKDEPDRSKDVPTNHIPNPSPARDSGIQRVEILPPSGTSEQQGAGAGQDQFAHTATVHDPHAQKHDASNEL